MNKLYSVLEVATQFKVSEQYIRRLLTSNKLKGQMVGKTWVIVLSLLGSLLNLYNQLI